MAYKEFDVDGVGKIKVYKRRSNRSLRLTVAANGDVRLTMPLWVPYKAGLAFANSKRAWLQTLNNPSLAILQHGQRIGKSHHLVFAADPETDMVRTRVRQTEIVVTYPANLSVQAAPVQAAAEAACVRALRAQATTLLGKRLAELAAQHDATYRDVTIKRLKGRWGSCDQQRHIVLNLYLVQLPWELIDYVILHELAHTTQLHHGAEFWQTLEGYQPRARELRKAIKAFQPTLLPGGEIVTSG